MKKKGNVVYSAQLGDERFSYSLNFRSNLAQIHYKIEYDFIRVTAPKDTTLDKVVKFLQNNQVAILAKITKNRILPLHKFADGEQFMFLGKSYTLIVKKNDIVKVSLEENNLVLYATDTNDATQKEKAIKEFYRDNARSLLVQLTRTVSNNINVKTPFVELYFAKATWGRCYSADDRIRLNYFLIFAPMECIEYVIVHELAHFEKLGHQKEFWNVVARNLPNHKELRKKLNDFCNRNFCEVARRYFFYR